jgi:hypothetical protein
MSVMEMLRSVLPAPERAPESRLEARLRAGLVGLATAVASLLAVLLPSILAWATDPKSSDGIGAAAGVGAALWLLAHGAHLAVGAGTIALVPLLLGAGGVLAAAYGLRRALRGAPADRVRLVAAFWWGGYAGGLALATLLTLAGPLRPEALSLVWAFVLVPGVALAWTLGRMSQDEPGTLGVSWPLPRIPLTIRRASGPALRGAGLLLTVGVLLVLIVVGLRFGSVLHVHEASGAGLLGSLLLVLGQVSALPNLGIWALSWLAGPGFQVVDGAPVTWSGAESGLLPLVPVFGALPGPGSFPWFVPGVVLVPVLAGAWIGRRSLGEVARLATARTKLSVALTATTLAALLIGLLDVVGGGALGGYKLSAMGAPALWLTLALVVELGLGALVVVLHDAWRLRR